MKKQETKMTNEYVLMVNKELRQISVAKKSDYDKFRKTKEFKNHFSSDEHTRFFQSESKTNLCNAGRKMKEEWIAELQAQINLYQNIIVQLEDFSEKKKQEQPVPEFKPLM